MAAAAERAVAELVGELVRIDSVNPSLVSGGAGEQEVAQFVAGWLGRAGVDVRVEDAGGRPLVLGRAAGTGGAPTLLINAHTDTVGVGGMRDAHQPRVEGRALHGRGAYDMKGGLAAAMLAIASLPPRSGDVVLAAVPDEEAGGLGTRRLLELGMRFDAAVIPEPTDLAVGVAHRGFHGFELETRGVAAHGSRPDLGVDAITRMGPVLVAVAELDERLRAGPRHPRLGTGSVHAGLIRGGQEVSTYPASCVVEGEWRTIPGDDPAHALQELACRTGAELRSTYTGVPFEVAADERIVEVIRRHAGTPTTALAYWSDAALLAAAGVPTVLFGPAGAGAHADEEWVDLDSVARVRDVLVAAAADFCA